MIEWCYTMYIVNKEALHMKKLFELVMSQLQGGKSVSTIKEERQEAVNELESLVKQLERI